MNKSVFRDMRWIGGLFALLLCVVLGSCQSEEETTFSGKTGLQVILTDEADRVYSRKAPSELEDPLASLFSLRVTYAGTDKSAYKGDFSETVLLKEGLYDLTATYGENPVIALDAPYYVGTLKGQEVVKGEMTSVSIPCSVANALLSVSYNEESLKKAFEAYWVTVSVGEESVDLDASSGQSAYFRAGSSVKLVFHGRWAGTGKEVSYDIPDQPQFANIEAKKHIKVTLGVDESSIASGVGISVEKLDVETVSVNETIPETCLPAPKIKTVGFDAETRSMDVYETESPAASIDFELSSALQEVEFSVNFEDEHLKSLNGDYTLSTMGEDVRNKFTEVGFMLPSVGAKEASIVIPTGSLLSNLDGNTVANAITIKKVVANGRENKEGEVTYTIHTHQPAMSFTVPEGNVWTKEFTAVMDVEQGKGNREKIGENLLFEYSADNGNSWAAFSDADTHRFAELPELKNYKVRATYRGKLNFDPVDIQLETPQQLPNSGMEDWSYEKVARSIITYNLKLEGQDSFWNTNNSYTTRYVQEFDVFGSGSNPYNCFPAVSYVPGRNSGKAAELRNTAAGRGNTKAIGHTELDLNKVAGELFVGNIEVVQGGTSAKPNGDHYTIQKGKEFDSRPTALHFWYKYAPCNTDTWKATLELLDEDKNVIISKTIQSSDAKSEFTEAVIPLDYQDTERYAKCKYIYVVFSSTINTGSALQYNTVDYTLWKDDSQVTFSHTYVGSVLTIDDISLIYDK